MMRVSQVLLNADTVPYLPTLFTVKYLQKKLGINSRLLLSSTSYLLESEQYLIELEICDRVM
jgi:hypothetical protein